MTQQQFYPIGVPGVPWQQKEKDAWRQQQHKQRSYKEILDMFSKVSGGYELMIYGNITYESESFELKAIRSANGCPSLPFQ